MDELYISLRTCVMDELFLKTQLTRLVDVHNIIDPVGTLISRFVLRAHYGITECLRKQVRTYQWVAPGHLRRPRFMTQYKCKKLSHSVGQEYFFESVAFNGTSMAMRYISYQPVVFVCVNSVRYWEQRKGISDRDFAPCHLAINALGIKRPFCLQK